MDLRSIGNAFHSIVVEGAGGSLWDCWSVGSRRGREGMIVQVSSFLFIVDVDGLI